MGRRILPEAKSRRVISISLPRPLVARFDGQLNGRTRSRVIQKLLEDSLKGKINIDDYSVIQHEWSCLDCGKAFRTLRPKDKTHFCIGKTCRSDLIEYIGVWRDEQ